MPDAAAPPGLLPDWLPHELHRIAAHCRAVADHTLGVELPEILVELSTVPPGQELLRTDYDQRIFVALASPDRVLPPPEGANLVYGVAHEVGHMVVARCLPTGAALPVVWDEAFAHFLALEAFFPALEAQFGSGIWPGETAGWPQRQAHFSPGWGFADQEAQLERMTKVLVDIAGRLGGSAVLLKAVAACRSQDLGLLRIERTLRRLTVA